MGYIKITAGGSLASGTKKPPTDGEHRLLIGTADSSLANLAAINAARDFIDRLEQNLESEPWSSAAQAAARLAGATEIIIDTLRDTPPAKASQRGTLVADVPIAASSDDIVDWIARRMHRAYNEGQEKRGYHANVDHDTNTQGEPPCPRCDSYMGNFDDLPRFKKEEYTNMAKAALLALHERGLVP